MKLSFSAPVGPLFKVNLTKPVVKYKNIEPGNLDDPLIETFDQHWDFWDQEEPKNGGLYS